MGVNRDFILGYGAGKASKTSQTIIEETDAWLEENISQETGYVLDRTLTLQNAAAPADMVGDLKSASDSLTSRVKALDGKDFTEWEIGSLGKNTNLTPPCNTVSTTYGIRTKNAATVHFNVGDVFKLSSYSGLKWYFYGNKTSDSSQVFGAGLQRDFAFPYECDCAILVEYVNTSTVADLNTLVPMISIERIDSITHDVLMLEEDIKPLEDVASGNLMPDASTWITGRVYDGVYSDAITSVKCTDYIPVVGGATYYIYGGYIDQHYFGVYGSVKELLSGWSFTSVTTNASNKSKCVITLNQNARYIRINALANQMSNFPTDAYIALVPSDLPNKADLTDYVPRIKGNGTLSDKKILVIGDSISTDTYGSYKKWVTFLCESYFFSSGFVKNDSYHATGYVATYKESGVVKKDTFLNRVSAMTDLDEYDLIITFGGINDWIQNVDFDDFKDAVDAYYAYLIENATQARICVITPLRTSLYGTNNTENHTQKDYDDYIKTVANEYALPVLNLTDESGFCPDKSETFNDMWTLLPAGFQDHDGVHPVEDWEKKYLAPQIAWFLAGII